MSRYDPNTVVAGAYEHLDEYVDCFSRTEHVVSDLMYGEMPARPPIISVLIPTYGRGELFRQALDSVLAQRAPGVSWEIVVTDNTPLDENGSTPALEAVRAAGPGCLRYYHNRENIGPGYSWNRAVELAQGTWVCFLHDDDVLCQDALVNIVRQIRAYRGKRELGYLHARRIDFAGAFVPPAEKHFPPERLTRTGVVISGCTGAGAPTCGTTILKKAYMETGGINYDLGPSADAVLCYQIMREHAVVCSERVLGGYRWGDNETLKEQALYALIRADELLAEFAYGQSTFGVWWGRRFGAASSWRNVYRKQKAAVRGGLSISTEELGRTCRYAEPSEVKKMLFLGLYALYRLLRLADGRIQSLVSYRWSERG